MVERIIMPKLAMAMQEGQVVEWLTEKGEWVDKGQPVMIVETEKVTHECEAPASGFFLPVLEVGVTVPVLETLALLAATEEELERLRAASPSTPAKTAEAEATAEDAVAAPAPLEPGVVSNRWAF
jgi:pyruvate/2-oxoglutarate dehydrogenase complex dihydrolipoamide acyltransferase (E2) component